VEVEVEGVGEDKGRRRENDQLGLMEPLKTGVHGGLRYVCGM
jgi:hypothetical protein